MSRCSCEMCCRKDMTNPGSFGMISGKGSVNLTCFAEEATRLRASYKLQTADAIQMATAIKRNASFFLTNDRGLPSLPDLKILMLDELKTRP